MTPTVPSRTVPTAAARGSLLLVAAGLAAAGYLTYEHFTASTTLACPETGRISCGKVTTSAYSQFLGLPVSVLGLCYFATLTPLMLPAAWRSPHAWVRWARLACVSLGIVSVLYLVWAELFRVGAICLWCTAVHLITFALFVLVVFAEALRAEADAWIDGSLDR